MKFVIAYSPDNGPAQRYDFDADDLRVAAAEDLERRFEGSLDELQQALMSGSVRAKRVALWHVLRQEHKELRYDDVDFRAGEVEVVLGRELLEQLHQAAQTATGVPEDKRRAAVAALEAHLNRIPGDGEEGQDDEVPAPTGKAPSKKKAASTA
ncbi:hypothetical protein [Amycolatopsis azurea]|uniref:Uncharacterized protein n=1 Tax=Amycolatopsis azurea DSM 43854 TaxID=1238180 RepID=M2Q8D6_9PSEU|nr:hypothetical protein [Amycolatopsis azurea]EMD22921.1 hypothetical protein C791_7921 [Amycolatopsis azurea DSM 43854]OOC04284.1 hypothetical protein B0293_23805 [Amycolatopsis azurea DSM 43854]